MLHILGRAVSWVQTTKDGNEKRVFPPREVADELLVTPEPPLPQLERIVEVPVLAADGSLHDRPGYDPATRCFLAPANGLVVPPVATRPSAFEVQGARHQLLELVRDFPFDGPDEGEHERSHALGLLLQPFVRALIAGNTPLHLFEAPTPGTGKTLLVMALAAPALGGRPLPAMAEARDGDEWRKRLTAKLRRAPEYVLLDNLRRPLDSSALALVLTSGVMEDRLLGVSDTVVLPVRCAWAATANNPVLSDEMTRRAVRVRLDAGVEFPEERDGFHHPNLLGYVRASRGELIWSALTLARGWLDAGSPDPEPPTQLGGFEDWVRVIGGILEWAELGTVCGNAGELRAANRDSGPGAFLRAVYGRLGPAEFTSGNVVALAQEHLYLGAGRDSELVQRLGYRLRELVDRPFGGYVLRRTTLTHENVRRWVVEKLS